MVKSPWSPGKWKAASNAHGHDDVGQQDALSRWDLKHVTTWRDLCRADWWILSYIIYLFIYIWRFPEIGVPPIINHPFSGTPIYGTPKIYRWFSHVFPDLQLGNPPCWSDFEFRKPILFWVVSRLPHFRWLVLSVCFLYRVLSPMFAFYSACIPFPFPLILITLPLLLLVSIFYLLLSIPGF